MFLTKYGSLSLYDEDTEKYLSLNTNNYKLIKMLDGLYLEFLRNLMELWSIMLIILKSHYAITALIA